MGLSFKGDFNLISNLASLVLSALTALHSYGQLTGSIKSVRFSVFDASRCRTQLKRRSCLWCVCGYEGEAGRVDEWMLKESSALS